MTIEELYDWAVDNNCEDFPLVISMLNYASEVIQEDLFIDTADEYIAITDKNYG